MASGTVRDHLDNRLDLQFEDMGEKALKEVVLRIGVGDVIVEGSDLYGDGALREQEAAAMEDRDNRLRSG